MYLTAKRLEKCQPRMAGNFTNKSALLVEIHALKVGFVCGKNLVGLWDHPDLPEGRIVSGRSLKCQRDHGAYLRAIIFNHGLRKVLYRLAFEQYLSKELCQPLCPLTCTNLLLHLRRDPLG